MSPGQIVQGLKPLLDRVYLGHCALVDGDNPPVATSRPLTSAKLEQHCSTDSSIRYGVYPIAPGESTTRCAVLDMDSHKGEVSMKQMVEHARKLEQVLQFDHGLSANVFRSSGGKGLHLIMLWDEPQDAYSVRAELAEALATCGFANGAKGVAKGQIEVFPKQDSVPADGWGNMFVLPLARKSVRLDNDLTWEPLDRGDAGDWAISAPVAVREKPQRALTVVDSTSHAKVCEMLEAIPNDSLDYEFYFKIMCAVHHATGGTDEGLQVFETWAGKHKDNNPDENLRLWGPLGKKTENLITGNTLKMLAEKNGYQDLSILANFQILDSDGEVVAEGDEPSTAVDNSPKLFRDKSGRILATKRSVSDAIAKCTDFTRMQVKYDVFLARMVRIDEEVGVRPLEDEDYTLIALRLEDKGFKDIPDTLTRACVRLIAKHQKFDSARQWIEGLPEWDGVPRIERFYHDYLGCRDSAYARALGMYQWSGMAGRVLDPGCKLDITPIWVGAQGTRKSSSVEALSPSGEFFGGVDLSLKDAEFSRKIRGKLVGEIGELKGMASRDRESIKEMLTRTHEEWTEKYVEFGTRYPRRIFLIATTNEDAVLDDPTGNRRFAPIRTGWCEPDAIKRDLAQLWAEGAAVWRDGGIRWQELGRLQADAQKEFEKRDAWHERVEQWLDGRDGVRVTEVLEDALYILPKDHDRVKEMRVASILTKLGYSRRQCRVDGVRAWRFFVTTCTTPSLPDLG